MTVQKPEDKARAEQAETEYAHVRSTLAISFFTLISRVLGYARFVLTIQLFASIRWASDALIFAFRIPNLFRNLFGEGALSAAFIPSFVAVRESEGGKSSSRLASQVATLLALIGGVITVVGVLICLTLAGIGAAEGNAELTLGLKLTAVFLFFMPCTCLAALLAGMLQSIRRFSLPACLSIIVNIGFLLGFAYVFFWQCGGDINAVSPDSAYSIAYFVLAAGVAEVLVQFPVLASSGVLVRPTLSFDHPGLKTVIKAFLPTALGLGLVQLNAFVDSLIAGALSLQNHGAITYLEIGSRFMQLPLGVFGVAIATVSFPDFASAAASRDDGRLLRHVVRAVRMSAFFLLPASALMIAMADPIIRLTCQRPDLAFDHAAVYRSTLTLCIYSAGLFFYSMRQILVRAYYAKGEYSFPVKVAAVMVAVNLVLNLTLIHFPDLYRANFREYFRYWNIPDSAFFNGLRLNEAGLALATAVTGILDSAILAIGLRKRLGGAVAAAKRDLYPQLSGTLARMSATALGLGVLTWLFRNSIPYAPEFMDLLARAAAPCLLAGGAFYIVGAVLPLPEMREFLFILFRRRPSGGDAAKSKGK